MAIDDGLKQYIDKRLTPKAQQQEKKRDFKIRDLDTYKATMVSPKT